MGGRILYIIYTVAGTWGTTVSLFESDANADVINDAVENYIHNSETGINAIIQGHDISTRENTRELDKKSFKLYMNARGHSFGPIAWNDEKKAKNYLKRHYKTKIGTSAISLDRYIFSSKDNPIYPKDLTNTKEVYIIHNAKKPHDLEYNTDKVYIIRAGGLREFIQKSLNESSKESIRSRIKGFFKKPVAPPAPPSVSYGNKKHLYYANFEMTIMVNEAPKMLIFDQLFYSNGTQEQLQVVIDDILNKFIHRNMPKDWEDMMENYSSNALLVALLKHHGFFVSQPNGFEDGFTEYVNVSHDFEIPIMAISYEASGSLVLQNYIDGKIEIAKKFREMENLQEGLRDFIKRMVKPKEEPISYVAEKEMYYFSFHEKKDVNLVDEYNHMLPRLLVTTNMPEEKAREAVSYLITNWKSNSLPKDLHDAAIENISTFGGYGNSLIMLYLKHKGYNVAQAKLKPGPDGVAEYIETEHNLDIPIAGISNNNTDSLNMTQHLNTYIHKIKLGQRPHIAHSRRQTPD